MRSVLCVVLVGVLLGGFAAAPADAAPPVTLPDWVQRQLDRWTPTTTTTRPRRPRRRSSPPARKPPRPRPVAAPDNVEQPADDEVAMLGLGEVLVFLTGQDGPVGDASTDGVYAAVRVLSTYMGTRAGLHLLADYEGLRHPPGVGGPAQDALETLTLVDS